MISAPRTVRAARGTDISCVGWPQEAALRMLCNNLDPDVAERPETGVQKDIADLRHDLARRCIVRALSQAARGTPQVQSSKKIR